MKLERKNLRQMVGNASLEKAAAPLKQAERISGSGHRKGEVMYYLLRSLRGLLLFAVVCGLCLCVAGVSSAASTPEKLIVRIGALLDQTGASTSPLYRAAVELAAKQMNQALTALGSRLSFEIVFADTKSNPQLAQTEALRLINQEGVQALVSVTSGETVAVNKLNYDPAGGAKQQLPITCFQCSSGFINNPAATEKEPLAQAAERDLEHWLFRVFYIANYEAAVQVQLALTHKKGDGAFKIGIFADGGHKSLATAITDSLPKFAAGVATETTYFTTSENLRADWEKVVNSPNGKPDVVIVAMLPGAAAEAIKAYRQANYTLPIQSNNSFRRNYILQQMGAIADGVEGSSVQLVANNAAGQSFLAAFKAAAGQIPEMTSSGAYDATVALMLAALQAAGDPQQPRAVTPAAIQQGLMKINDPAGQQIRPTVEDFSAAAKLLGQGKPINYEGAYNALDWDSAGDIFPQLVHWKVENQQFVETERYQCDPQHPLCPVVK
jgi:ABC-type branched-subunit amino acid transport system substrate-binding protein